ncbi:MAG TPA: HEAT repeat domain-containing protein [Terracidiphilus sp.]|nr:HEAT repeat domain-containing protein [Terracidiphilus sp.]
MNDAGNDLKREIEAFRDGRATLDQLRDLAAGIGRQHWLTEAPILVELLQNGDEIVRYNAIMSLGFELKLHVVTDSLIKMVEEDPDGDCRDAAAGALGVMWRSSKDHRIIEQLSKVALEDSDEDVRKAAYFALIVVNGISDEEYLEMLRHKRAEVNWDKVAAIRAEIAGQIRGEPSSRI